MKFLKYSFVALIAASFVACGGGGSDSSDKTPISSTDVTVERGPIYEATVKDNTGKIAKQKKGKNIYTFDGVPSYPISVTGGWIDVDNDGKMSTSDLKLNMTMKSYYNVVTPITTYIANSDESKRKERIKNLLNTVNNYSEENITEEELLKLPSKSQKEVQMAVNALFAEMIENNSTQNLSLDEVSIRINDLKNIDFDNNLSKLEVAKIYENYIINTPGLKSTFDNIKLTSEDIIEFKIPKINIESTSKEKHISIIRSFPLSLWNDAQNRIIEEYKNRDLKIYKLTTNANCKNDFKDYKSCLETSFDNMFDDMIVPQGSKKITIILVLKASSDQVDNPDNETGNFSINDLLGKTFYTIDKEDPDYITYSKMTMPNEFTVETANSSNDTDKDYVLQNGKWVEESDEEEDEDKATSVKTTNEKLIVVSNNGKTTTLIKSKNSEYWTIELRFEGKVNNSPVNYVTYQNWYLSPTQEMLDPSTIKK